MENHPIPQDVTGFQFKLIGNMTVKQFGYLAFGAVLAVICYYAPIFVLIKFPLVALFATSGICLAFVPIEGRPMDAMVNNFIKALVVPNQYVFHKMGGHLLLETASPHPSLLPSMHKEEPKKKDKKETAAQKAEELEYYIHHLPRKIQNSLDEKERMLLQSLPVSQPQIIRPPEEIVAGPSVSISHHPTPEMPEDTKEKIAPPPASQSSQVIKIPQELTTQATVTLPDKTPLSADEIEKEAEKARIQLGLPKESEKKASPEPNASSEQVITSEPVTAPETTPPQPEVLANEKTQELEGQLHDVALQKQQLEDELVSLKKQLSQKVEEKPKDAYTPKVQEKREMEHVRKISADMARSVGLPNVPDVPNLVTGIVKDPRGNVLPHILVEIKDQEGNPVRAFKTNTLGQFASATPLSNGTYTIEFEDAKGQHTFDIVELTVSGKIILPIEIISHDAREELRKALFN